MKPSPERIKQIIPNIKATTIDDHLSALNPDYFNYFSTDDICKHLQLITQLSCDLPIQLIITKLKNDQISLNIVSHDYPSVLSIITGILASSGFNITDGKIFSYKKQSTAPLKTRYLNRSAIIKLAKPRYIIDHFSGSIDKTLSFQRWKNTISEQFHECFLLLYNKQLIDAKEKVDRWVAKKLYEFKEHTPQKLTPMELSVDQTHPDHTRFIVSALDSPFFLYSLSSAFSQHQVSIIDIHISTIDNQIKDIFDLVDKNEKKISDPKKIDQLKLSLLLTKQFTFFLDQAPNPFDALSRYSDIVTSISTLPDKGKWIKVLSHFNALNDMSKLLGASNYLWENFICLNYEVLLPILKSRIQEKKTDFTVSTLQKRLNRILKTAKTYEDCQKLINEFKDQMIFLIDLNHIFSSLDSIRLSKHLTELADVLFDRILATVYQNLINKYGRPKTIAGLETHFGLFALGKYGGGELGFGSDIELLLIYSDNGQTDGKISISNIQFFEILLKEAYQFIQSKQDGIFQIDLRLRPYGHDGPLAVSLENFCHYYGYDGPAHAYEKQSLVRMRAIGGNARFCRRTIRIKNELIYETPNIAFEELWTLRKKQFQEKITTSSLNAKYSPGALVDIEYTIQVLQIMYGHQHKSLRTASIQKALKALYEENLIMQSEYKLLKEAYLFFTRLINGLRMLRGSAKDVEIPPIDSEEYAHLARRIGYTPKNKLEPSQKLTLEFDVYSAIVRSFIEKKFARKALLSKKSGNVADIILNKKIPDELAHTILKKHHFHSPERALVNIRKMAALMKNPQPFARVAVLACVWISRKPNPDNTLNHWERFLSQIQSPSKHFKLLINQPMRLEILLDIFSVSQFLSNALIQNPDFFEWLTSQEQLYKPLNRIKFIDEIKALSTKHPSYLDWLNQLRLLRKRELLRIAIKDVSLQLPLQKITGDLSVLAETFLQSILNYIWNDLKQKYSAEIIQKLSDNFCIIAMGKLGGNELNYSSDMDLVAIYDDTIRHDKMFEFYHMKKLYTQIVAQISQALSTYTDTGFMYRLDFRLRPYGQSGELVSSVSQIKKYYTENAAPWEIQALLKARPVAGNWIMGFEFVYTIFPECLKKLSVKKIQQTIQQSRDIAIKSQKLKTIKSIDIKVSEGGLRDIEFLVQRLQLQNVELFTYFPSGNTLQALKQLLDATIISKSQYSALSAYYIFYRNIEHFLQILDDRQRYTLPKDNIALLSLTKRLLGRKEKVETFIEQVKNTMNAVKGLISELA